MPIDGTESWERLQRLGFVRRGVKEDVFDKDGQPVLNRNGEQKQKPRATGYFIIPDEVKHILKEDKPIQLPIYFLLELEKALPHFLMRYSGNGKLRCMGDGSSIWYRRYINVPEQEFLSLIYNRVAKWSQITDRIAGMWEEQYGTMEHYGGDNGNTLKCLFRSCPQFKKRYCKPTAFLRFGIKGIVRQGYYQMTVHQLALADLLWQLRWARDIVEQYLGEATIVHTPFLMTLLGPEEMFVNGYKTQVWTPRLEIEPEWLERAMEGRVKLPHRAQIRVTDIWGGKRMEVPPMPVRDRDLDVTEQIVEEELDYDPHGDDEEEDF